MARKRGLDLGQVVEAAATLADAHGIDRVSLADVAAALGVRSPSLYSHVDGLGGLRRAMAIEAASRLGSVMSDAVEHLDGPEALRSLASAYRAFATAHPGLYASLLTTPTEKEDPEVYAALAGPVPAITAVLLAMQIPEAEAIPLIRALRSSLHGFVALEASGGFGLPDDVDTSFDILVDVVVAGISSRACTSRPGGERPFPRSR